jgi:DNA repair exonuclease SbcCD nuclease subunit
MSKEILIPIAYLCSDYHWTATPPKRWTGSKEEWLDYLDQPIKDMLHHYDVESDYFTMDYHPLFLIAGDVFDKWNNTTADTNTAITRLRNVFDSFVSLDFKNVPLFGVLGQHDLPNHSMELKEKSSAYSMILSKDFRLLDCRVGQDLLRFARQITIGGKTYYVEIAVTGYSWMDGPNKETKIRHPSNANELVEADCWIHLEHKYVHNKTKEKIPGLETKENSIPSILKELPKADIVLIGDNHTPFQYETDDGRTIFNHGAMVPRSINEIKNKDKFGFGVVWCNVETGKTHVERIPYTQDFSKFDTSADMELEETIATHKDFGEIVARINSIGNRTVDFREVIKSWIGVQESKQSTKLDKAVKEKLETLLEVLR